MKKASVILLVIILLFSISGCKYTDAVEFLVDKGIIKADKRPLYDRGLIEDRVKGSRFGYGQIDDETLAMWYVYNTKEFEDLYGKDFKITNVGGTSDVSQINNDFSGKAYYRIEIDNKDEWVVELKKDFSKKWEVVEHHRLSEDKYWSFEPPSDFYRPLVSISYDISKSELFSKEEIEDATDVIHNKGGIDNSEYENYKYSDDLNDEIPNEIKSKYEQVIAIEVDCKLIDDNEKRYDENYMYYLGRNDSKDEWEIIDKKVIS